MKHDNHIKDCIERFAQGGMLIVMDDEQRENEGDLIFAAQHSTPEKINFLIRHTTGILCTPLTSARALSLGLHAMTPVNTEYHSTKFTVSCDHISTTTGVSALDRHRTISALATLSASGEQFRKPGHIFPLIAHAQGLRGRQGHTEAALTLCELAEVTPVGVIGELMNEDGTMKRYDDCEAFGKQHDIPILTIKDLLIYLDVHKIDPAQYAPAIQEESESMLYINNGKDIMKCQCKIFAVGTTEHAVLLYGNWQEHEVVTMGVPNGWTIFD